MHIIFLNIVNVINVLIVIFTVISYRNAENVGMDSIMILLIINV